MDKLFEFKADSSNITLNVGAFFSTAQATQINKMLKLINKNCSCEQKKKLLDYLCEELTIREAALNKLSEIIQQLSDLLSSFGLFDAYTLFNKKNALEKQCEKIRKYIKILKQPLK